MFITLKQYHIFHNNVLGMKWPKRCKKSPFHCLGYHPKILVSVGWILPNQLSPEPENLDSNIIQSVDELNVLSVSDKGIKLLPKLLSYVLEGRKRLKYLISILIDSHIFIFVSPLLFRTLKAIRKLFIISIQNSLSFCVSAWE